MAKARPGSQVSPLRSRPAVPERLRPGADPPAAWLAALPERVPPSSALCPAPCALLGCSGGCPAVPRVL